MVENAIRQGICGSGSGGTPAICAFETPRCFRVTVTDEGRGFDARARSDDRQRHLGVESSRRCEVVGGILEIASTPGEGTTVTMEIQKPARGLGPVTGQAQPKDRASTPGSASRMRSVKIVRDHCRSGDIECVRVGGQWRIHRNVCHGKPRLT